ncbi:hypothetical protein [Dickeya sp. DW 0440]|uniref:hypothetical protein n=1 Tax=Dickeya sp. DW 0440 TaxID=1225785 RepID=UPI000A74530D|nr:hypothetical protein [Dickeya sp. DW 0440]
MFGAAIAKSPGASTLWPGSVIEKVLWKNKKPIGELPPIGFFLQTECDKRHWLRLRVDTAFTVALHI